jgi:hypothetical protein
MSRADPKVAIGHAAIVEAEGMDHPVTEEPVVVLITGCILRVRPRAGGPPRRCFNDVRPAAAAEAATSDTVQIASTATGASSVASLK